MAKALLLGALVFGLGRDPVAAALVVVAVLWLAEGGWQGRLWTPLPWLQRFRRASHLRSILAANPSDLPSHAELGRLLVGMGRCATALPHLERAVGGMPQIAEPWFHLGRALLGLGRRDEGRKAVMHSLELRPDLLFGAPHRELALDARAHGEHEAAVEHLRNFTSLRGSSSEGWFLLADSLQALGRKAEVKEALGEAIAGFDQSPAYLRRGQRTWRWRAWWRLRG
jgi:Flp pilus assembly protein TadD